MGPSHSKLSQTHKENAALHAVFSIPPLISTLLCAWHSLSGAKTCIQTSMAMRRVALQTWLWYNELHI